MKKTVFGKDFHSQVGITAYVMCACTFMLTLMLVSSSVQAFSLLGPYAGWMDLTNNFRQQGDIGGPMNLNEEYRWNVPVVTYAFDQSFLNFFGSNGVAAVESAIGILNNLPPASQINPGNYPPLTTRYNFRAQAEGLFDLKSQTLVLLIEHLGLAQPTRFAFCLKDFAITNGTVTGTVLQRNFDPFSLGASSNVNDNSYSYYLASSSSYLNTNADALEFLVDPNNPNLTAVADSQLRSGGFYSGLTRDDIGGLRYLLSSNNVNDEILLSDVHGTGTNQLSYVNRAPRPGIEKITLIRQQYDSGGQVIPITNLFTDTYITNSMVEYQQLERDIRQPDFLFCADDLSEGNADEPVSTRSGTSNWWNSAASLGNPPSGSGLILPPVTFTFHKRGPSVLTSDGLPEESALLDLYQWGSFDSSTNPPVMYPDGFGTNQFILHLWLRSTSSMAVPGFTWKLPVPMGEAVTLQTSTDLSNWLNLTSVTNNGTVVNWQHWHSQPRRFFRLVEE